MNAIEGAKKQIEVYRCMSGHERLKIAFEMWEIALAQAKRRPRGPCIPN